MDSVSSTHFLKELIKFILHSMLQNEDIDIVPTSEDLSIRFVHMIKQIFIEFLMYIKTKIHCIYAFKVKDSFENVKE